MNFKNIMFNFLFVILVFGQSAHGMVCAEGYEFDRGETKKRGPGKERATVPYRSQSRGRFFADPRF